MAVVSEKKPSGMFALERHFSHANLISNLSVRGFLQKQGEYRQQIVNYSASAKELSHAADILKSPQFLEEKNIDITGFGVFAETGVSYSAKTGEYDVEVAKLALPQINEGKIFQAKDPSIFASGIYTLSVDSFGKPEKQATVYITENDTMKRVIQKFSNVINAVGSDVVAQLKEQQDEVYIYLEAREPGINNSFTIRDINGNAAEELGFNHVVQSSHNNHYSIDGIKYESASNIIKLDDDNIVLNVSAVTDNAKVNITRNYNKPIIAVRDITEQYNSLQDILLSTSNISDKGKKLLTGITFLVDNLRKEDFQSIGVSIDKETKRMVVDENKLFESMSDNPEKVRELLSEKPGLGTLSKSLAKTVRANPLNSFVKTPAMLDSIDYGWRWRSAGSLGIISLGAFAAFNQGMFFDIFI
jgi:flagellar capping protein FliD